MKALVTGASGAIGGLLASRLAREGQEVRALVRPDSDVSGLDSPGIELAHGDLRDPASLDRAVQGCRLVYHLARAKSRPSRRRSSYFRINVEGTSDLAHTALEHGVERFVHVSSTAVYGRGRRQGLDEASPPRPVGFHARSKLASERVVIELAGRHGLRADVVRLPYVLGPGQLGLLRLFRQVRGGRVVLLGRGEVQCRILDAADAVEALLLCGARRRASGECFVIAGAEELTLRGLVELIAGELGVAVRPRSLPAAPIVLASELSRLLLHPFGYESRLDHGVRFFTRQQGLDGAKARRELGWAPRFSARQTVRRMLDWYRAMDLLQGAGREPAGSRR